MIEKGCIAGEGSFQGGEGISKVVTEASGWMRRDVDERCLAGEESFQGGEGGCGCWWNWVVFGSWKLDVLRKLCVVGSEERMWKPLHERNSIWMKRLISGVQKPLLISVDDKYEWQRGLQNDSRYIQEGSFGHTETFVKCTCTHWENGTFSRLEMSCLSCAVSVY